MPSLRGWNTWNSPSGVAAVEHAPLGSRGTDRRVHQKFFVVRATHAEAVEFVLLLVDQTSFSFGSPIVWRKSLVRPLGGVLGDVEDGLVVAGPFEAGDFDELVLEQLAGLQVFDRQVVFAEAGGVGREGVELAVVADAGRNRPSCTSALRPAG